jgi:hypothetical protein
MKQFKVGDRVRIVRGPRAGEVCHVSSELRRPECDLEPGYHGPNECWCFDGDILLHDLDLKSLLRDYYSIVAAPPSWLEPMWDGKEPCSWEECLWRPKRVEENA